MALPSEKKSGPDSGPSTSFPHPALPRPRRPWVLLAPAPPLPPCRSIGQEQPQQRWALAAVAARAAFKMTVAVEPNIPNHNVAPPQGEGRPSHASDVLLLGTGVQSKHRELEHGERGDRVSVLGRLRFFLRFIECDFAAALRSRHTHACSGSQHRHASDVVLPGSRRRRARQTHGRVRLAETGVGIRGNETHLKHARWNGQKCPLCGCEILSL